MSHYTQFLNTTDWVKLQVGLEKGDKESIRCVFDELARLESIIKNYEIGIQQIHQSYTSRNLKKPNKP